jgi:hypothetical protein
VSTDEVDKLVRAGCGWLAGHPERDLITGRYLAHQAVMRTAALARLAEVTTRWPRRSTTPPTSRGVTGEPERAQSLAGLRISAVLEYALGLEALGRLVAGEPLWRVHECVFAVLALESEPVDPRL